MAMRADDRVTMIRELGLAGGKGSLAAKWTRRTAGSPSTLFSQEVVRDGIVPSSVATLHLEREAVVR
jgi:hypothetical protein